MKYQSRADLLIAAGESIKMQEKAGIEPKYKSQQTGITFPISEARIMNADCNLFEFPLAVVEGKPVFVGDELYSPLGMRFIVDENGMPCCPNTCSWSPPKPKTVMVELLRKDAEWMVRAYDGCNSKAGRIAESCRKALEKA